MKYQQILEYRIKLKNIIDLVGLLITTCLFLIITLNDQAIINFPWIADYKNIMSVVLVFGILGVVRYRLYSCPKCQQSLKVTKYGGGQFFEPFPHYCPNCQLNLNEQMGLKEKEFYPIRIIPNSIPFFSFLFILASLVYVLYKIEFFSREDILYVVFPSIGILAVIISSSLVYAKLKACRTCGMPFQTGKYCRRCGNKTKN